MQSFHLQDEFTDPSAEQALIAAVARDVTLYWELLDVLSPDLFTKEAETWKRVKLTLETEQRPTIPNDWHPASEPHAIAQRLADLSRRRILAALQERIAEALFDDTTPATEVATLLEEEVLRVQLAFRESNTGRLQWASEILPQILADADARRGSGREWYVLPGRIPLRLSIPHAVRDQAVGVAFKSVWVNTGRILRTFHTVVWDETESALAPPEVTVEFPAPVYDQYHLWAEVLDRRGERHLSPTVVLQCVERLPDNIRLKPLKADMPNPSRDD